MSFRYVSLIVFIVCVHFLIVSWSVCRNESDEIYSVVGVIQTLILVCWKLRRRPVLVSGTLEGSGQTNEGYLILA
ncbi:hypothetical protein HanIR_Chr03g0140421 [Helianthus annuus]|nr:hypothetical protein HanIR_Chr03g0140421 [Helianthus annuus]